MILVTFGGHETMDTGICKADAVATEPATGSVGTKDAT